MPSIDRLSVWSEVVYISKGYKGLDPLGLRVLQKLCSESPLLVPRPGVPFVGKKQYKTKGKNGQVLSRLWYHLSYTVLSFQCNVKIFTKHLVDCNSRLILGTIAVSECVWLKSDVRGTQREILRKKTPKQQQSVNKAFWSHFQHFGRLLEKMHLFLTPPGPARLTEEFPTNKVHLQPATWLTGGGGGGEEIVWAGGKVSDK